MIIQTKELKDACTVILAATSSSQAAVTTNELELRTTQNFMQLRVASNEYDVCVRFDAAVDDEFHATVSADLFLKLITQITVETMDVSIRDNSLLINANGKYKIPLICHDGDVLEVKGIEIYNPTVQMSLNGEILQSIYTYNSKELLKGIIKTPTQYMYYVDEKGCITYTSGACVNKFSLDKPIKVLLTNKVVKLFKLFKGEEVDFTLGYDALSEKLIQTKVRFESKGVTITAIIGCDDTPINQVPVEAIRNRAEAIQPHTVSINRLGLLQAINRLLLFNSDIVRLDLKDVGNFHFEDDILTIKDARNVNSEDIRCSYSDMKLSPYEALINLKDLKTTLETLNDTNITISFGDHTSINIRRDNVTLIIPESRVRTSSNELE